jgi:uncharacterized cupredoxin-like copper-binding protein
MIGEGYALKKWGATVGAVVLLGVLFGCSSGSSASVETVRLTTEHMAFSTKEIRVMKGTPINLVLTNKDTTLHDFSIDKIPAKVKQAHGSAHGDHGAEPVVHVAADAGKSGSVEFTPTQAGTYTFYCTVPGHKDAGMEGKLIVE